MGDLYLNPGESIVLTANKVSVNFVPFDVILTTNRLIFVDSTYARFDPQMIPLEDIFSVKGGKIATGEPTITLTIARAESPEHPESTDLLFSQQQGERRMPESKEWLRKLMETIVAVRQKSTVTDSHDADAETGMRPSIRRWIAPEILAPHKVIADVHPPAPIPDPVPEPADFAPEHSEEKLLDSGKRPEVSDSESSLVEMERSPLPDTSLHAGENEKAPESSFVEEAPEAEEPGQSDNREDGVILPVPGVTAETDTPIPEEQSAHHDGSENLATSPEEIVRDTLPEVGETPLTPVPFASEMSEDDRIIKESGEPLYVESTSQDWSDEPHDITVQEKEESPEMPARVNWPVIPAPAIEYTPTPVFVSSDKPEPVQQPEEEAVFVDQHPEPEKWSALKIEEHVPEHSDPAIPEENAGIPDSTREETVCEEAPPGKELTEEISHEKLEIVSSGLTKNNDSTITETPPSSEPDRGISDPNQEPKPIQENPSIESTIESPNPEEKAIEEEDKEEAITRIPEENIPPPPQPLNNPFRGRMVTGILVIAVILIALTGIALIASTAFNGNTTHPVITPVPTPSPIITTSPAPVTIPDTGVWVRVMYNRHYYGQLGNPGDLKEISDTGDKFYFIRDGGKLVQVRVEKQDNTGDVLAVEIYRNGTVIDSEMIRTPLGEISLLIDPATGKPPVGVTPKATSGSGTKNTTYQITG